MIGSLAFRKISVAVKLRGVYSLVCGPVLMLVVQTVSAK